MKTLALLTPRKRSPGKCLKTTKKFANTESQGRFKMSRDLSCLSLANPWLGLRSKLLRSLSLKTPLTGFKQRQWFSLQVNQPEAAWSRVIGDGVSERVTMSGLKHSRRRQQRGCLVPYFSVFSDFFFFSFFFGGTRKIPDTHTDRIGGKKEEAAGQKREKTKKRMLP